MRRAAAFLALLLITGCASVNLRRVPTTLQLIDILDIRVWWLPLPDGKQWTIDMADAQPLGTKTAGLLHAGRESMISMRPVDDRSTYEFTIGQHSGSSRGTIDLCEGIDCGGQWNLEFFDPPRCNADCSAYIAGQVTVLGGARRQIVLTLVDVLIIGRGRLLPGELHGFQNRREYGQVSRVFNGRRVSDHVVVRAARHKDEMRAHFMAPGWVDQRVALGELGGR